MAEIKIKNKKFIYKNSIEWQKDMRGLLSSSDKPGIEIATPPEFRGHPGIWSPEDLFVAAVNSCIMTTFLHYAQKEHLEILNYESQAEGILELVNNHLIFTEIKIKPSVSVKNELDSVKAKNIFKLSENNCLISNSIKSKVEVASEIKIGTLNDRF